MYCARKPVTSCMYCEQASHDHHCNKFPWRRIETKTDSEYGKEFNAFERGMPKSKIKSDDYDSRTIATFAKFSSKVCCFSLCRTTPSRLKQKAAQTQHISICRQKPEGDSTNFGSKFQIHTSTKNWDFMHKLTYCKLMEACTLTSVSHPLLSLLSGFGGCRRPCPTSSNGEWHGLFWQRRSFSANVSPRKGLSQQRGSTAKSQQAIFSSETTPTKLQ